MSINDEREKERAEDKKLIDEWLAKGNKITVYPYGARSEEVGSMGCLRSVPRTSIGSSGYR